MNVDATYWIWRHPGPMSCQWVHVKYGFTGKNRVSIGAVFGFTGDKTRFRGAVIGLG